MLAAVKQDSDRIFEAQLSKKNTHFCARHRNAVPGMRKVSTPELRGLDGSKIRDADAFLVPLIQKGRTKGTVKSLESELTVGGNASGALALRAALPLSLKAWDKYRPDLVNRSVIDIDAVQFEGDLFLVEALARQPDLMEAARKAARAKKLYLNYR